MLRNIEVAMEKVPFMSLWEAKVSHEDFGERAYTSVSIIILTRRLIVSLRRR